MVVSKRGSDLGINMNENEHETMINDFDLEDDFSKKKSKTEDMASFSFKNINPCFTISLLLSVGLGATQIGYMIGLE
jgi:hypothetical protein